MAWPGANSFTCGRCRLKWKESEWSLDLSSLSVGLEQEQLGWGTDLRLASSLNLVFEICQTVVNSVGKVLPSPSYLGGLLVLSLEGSSATHVPTLELCTWQPPLPSPAQIGLLSKGGK